MVSPTPLLIAHRGESFDAPENTHAAFDLAWQRGGEAIELDVHLTADGEVAVCHDRDTLRTGGVKHVIARSTLAALQMLDVGAWKGACWAGQRIAKLADVLRRVPAGRQVFLEIKSGVDAVTPAVQILQDHSHAVVTVIAFDIEVVRLTKQRWPKLPALWLVSPKRDGATGQWSPGPRQMIEQARSVCADGLNIDAAYPIDTAFVRQTHDAGMRFCVWTVDDAARAGALAAMGVDGITSNQAARLRRQLGLEPGFEGS